MGYEICREIEREKFAPPAMAFFPAAASPPHLYSLAVMRLYMTRSLNENEPPPLQEVMKKLRGWKELPKEMLMLVTYAP